MKSTGENSNTTSQQEVINYWTTMDTHENCQLPRWNFSNIDDVPNTIFYFGWEHFMYLILLRSCFYLLVSATPCFLSWLPEYNSSGLPPMFTSPIWLYQICVTFLEQQFSSVLDTTLRRFVLIALCLERLIPYTSFLECFSTHL